jgi:hypothetical protein
MSGKPNHLIDPPFITKKEDPGRLTITCSIGSHVFHNGFYDLGASINIMFKVTYDKILGGPLSAAHFQLQMVDQSLQTPEEVAKNILVKIRDTYIPMDFVVLDMGHNKKVPLLLGRPFLNTTNIVLHVWSGHVSFHIQGQTMRYPFNGFNMHKYTKNKQPKIQPQKNIKRVWQVKKVQPTSLGTDVPSSSKE